MVVCRGAPLTSCTTALPQPKAGHNYQSRWMVPSSMTTVMQKRCLYSCQYTGRHKTRRYPVIKESVFQHDALSSKPKWRFTCHVLPKSDNLTAGSELESLQNVIEENEVIDELTSNPMGLSGKQDTYHQGRCGFATFYGLGLVRPELRQGLQAPNEAWPSVLWILGPVALLSSLVLPPFFLRKLFEAVLEESLVSDFLVLFFTETFFYIGVAVFLAVADKVQRTTGVVTWNASSTQASLGYQISAYVTLALAILLPIGAFAIVWPWTGPAAAAALVPYVAGLGVQYGIEHIVQERKSSVWPLIPIVFQVYRLHQLNRATQLITGLLFSLRGVESTAESLAVNGSLSTLVSALQILGLLSLWSLAAYLTHIFSMWSRDNQQLRVLS